jgi:hypothetical protein
MDRNNLWSEMQDIWLSVEDGQLIANPNDRWSGMHATGWRLDAAGEVAALQEPVLFFIPENAPDPSRLNPGEELWVEVTVPKRGPPRPIRLGLKKGGVLTPLDLH